LRQLEGLLLGEGPLDYKISVQEIVARIRKLKPGKATGLDHIGVELLKAIANNDIKETYDNSHTMLRWLCDVYNQVLDSGVMPKAWQIAVIKPLYKSGDRTDWSNYRLISLTSCVGKLSESVLAFRISSAFDKKVSCLIISLGSDLNDQQLWAHLFGLKS